MGDQMEEARDEEEEEEEESQKRKISERRTKLMNTSTKNVRK